jgi:hypothetical protein
MKKKYIIFFFKIYTISNILKQRVFKKKKTVVERFVCRKRIIEK